MTHHLHRLVRFTIVSGAAAALALAPLTASASPSGQALPTSFPFPHSAVQPAASPADGTAAGAIEWFKDKKGDSSMEGLCEMAVENAYGTTGVWPSAASHWQGAISAGKAHKKDTNPPQGAFVYWNTSSNGHVGIADGNGGFYSTSVNGAVGHSSSLSHFDDYLGWSDPQVPR